MAKTSLDGIRVHRAALILAASALASALAALMRDRLLAGLFGASRDLDMYFAAFRIPDMLYALGLFVVSSTAVLPLLAARRARSNEDEKDFVRELTTTVFLLFAVGGGVLMVITPFIVPVMFPGFTSAEAAEVAQLSRLLLLSPLLLGLSALFASVVQSRGYFFSTAIAPVIYNVGIIAGIVMLAPRFGLLGVVSGVLIGAALHMFGQLIPMIHTGFSVSLGRIRWLDIRELITKSAPRSAAISIQGAIAILMTSLASLFGAGAIAVYQLSFNLATVPLSIIGLSYSTAAFPLLSRFAAEKKYTEFMQICGQVVRQVMLWSILAAVLMIVLRAHIVRAVLGAGAFTWVDTKLAAAALACFAFGLVAQTQLQVFTRASYALNDMKSPLIASITGGVVAITVAYILQLIIGSSDVLRSTLEMIFRLEDVRMIRVLSLPLGYASGMIAATLILMLRFRSRTRHMGSMHITRSTLEHIAGGLALLATSMMSLRLLSPYFPLETLPQVLLQGVVAGVLGLVVAVAVLWKLGNDEVLDMLRALHGRLQRRTVSLPEIEHL